MLRRLINLGLCLLLLLPLWSAPRAQAAMPAPACPMAADMAGGHRGGCCGPQAPCACREREQPSDPCQMTLTSTPRPSAPAAAGLTLALAAARPQDAILAAPQPRARAPVPLRLLLSSYRI